MNKISAYNEIQQTLQEIFINNLNFFKQNHSLIYNKILEFERLNIKSNSIDFVDDKFKLINLSNKVNFYENEPFEDAINRVNNFDLGSAFNLIKLEPLEKRNHYENEINAYEYLNEFIKNFQNINIKINKFIFLGTLLGVHINDFHKYLKAKVYFIIEPNVEIFRLSMFMTDYKILSDNSKLFFAINENENELKEIAKKFLNYNYQYNNLIHFELAHKINEPLINQLTFIFTHLGEMRHPFSEHLISLNRFHNYFIKSNYNLLNISKTYNFLANKEVLFLGAGPSLEKDLDFIYKNKNKLIIVAVAATLKTLEIRNIIPDIIITVDGQEIVKEQFNVKKSMYINSIILSSIKLDPTVYKLFKNSDIFFFQNSLNLIDDLGFITGVTVGDMGIDILLRLGVTNLFLLGIDAAIDSETGKTHASTHIFSKEINLKENINDNQIDFNKTIIYVKGNFQDSIPTFMEYKEMIEEINLKLEKLNSNFSIYNLSNGAYFNNTIPTISSEINLTKKLNKINFKNNLLLNLNKISEKNLVDQFLKTYREERDILVRISLLKKDDTFLDQFKNIQKQYLSSISINILEKYLELILPYYNFTQKDNLSNKKFQKQLDEIIHKLFIIFQ